MVLMWTSNDDEICKAEQRSVDCDYSSCERTNADKKEKACDAYD